MTDDDRPLIDDIGIARLLARLRAARDHDPSYGVTRTEFLARAQEIAVRQAERDRRRRRKLARLERPLETMLPHQVPALPDPVDRIIATIDICDAIDRLSRHERQVLLQSFVARRPTREIALSLRLTERTIRALKASATAKLRKSETST